MANIEIPDSLIEIGVDYHYGDARTWECDGIRGVIKVCGVDVWYGPLHEHSGYSTYEEDEAKEDAKAQLVKMFEALVTVLAAQG